MKRLTVLVLGAVGAVVLIKGAYAQAYTWVNDVPPQLAGTWVEKGQDCKSEHSKLVIFSDGGYRWRRTRTEWGFARGKFSWVFGDNAVYFRLQRFVQQPMPDFLIKVDGIEMKKYSYGSNLIAEYDKCRD